MFYIKISDFFQIKWKASGSDELRNPVNIKLIEIFTDTFWTSPSCHESAYCGKIWYFVILGKLLENAIFEHLGLCFFQDR